MHGIGTGRRRRRRPASGCLVGILKMALPVIAVFVLIYLTLK